MSVALWRRRLAALLRPAPSPRRSRCRPTLEALEDRQTPSHVGVAFGPAGEVIELVTSSGQLLQFDAAGGHVIGGNVRAASVAFFNGSEVLLVTFSNGGLAQYDAGGAHALATANVQDASVAFGPAGEVIDEVTAGGVLMQFDAAGAHNLGGGFQFQTTGAAFDPSGAEVLLATSPFGALLRLGAGSNQVLAPTGVNSVGVAFGPGGEVADVIFSDGSLFQVDASGAHFLGKVP